MSDNKFMVLAAHNCGEAVSWPSCCDRRSSLRVRRSNFQGQDTVNLGKLLGGVAADQTRQRVAVVAHDCSSNVRSAFALIGATPVAFRNAAERQSVTVGDVWMGAVRFGTHQPSEQDHLR
ncbi:MAG TPA: hypothetical protein VE197_09765 [Mycobacterium sp.]|nr:hypothetical protein [Mycobacterium sp.]